MRGVFSAGVLDVFLERGFDPFDLAVGVSAGACNLASHIAGQHGRNRRCYMELMTSREFIDPRRLVRGRSMLDLDWLWARLAEREPLQVDLIATRPIEFVIVATARRTGRAIYLTPGAADMNPALKASSALPVFFRRRLTVCGEELVDGGVADPIPVEEAYRRGARRIVVLRSRPAGAVKKDGASERLMAWLLRREPALASAVRGTAAAYQRAVAFLATPPGDCRIVQVAPPAPLATTRTSQDLAALEHDYALGRGLADAAMLQWAQLSPTP